jgi:hypothetical protein
MCSTVPGLRLRCALPKDGNIDRIRGAILNLSVIRQQCARRRLSVQNHGGECRGELTREKTMPAFGPELTQLMRSVLDEVMAKVPVESSSPAVKARLAECILKAAAQGHTTYSELVTAASNQIQVVVALLT